MNDLNFAERELLALGAALGSNCVPCIEHHVTEARRAGLTDSQISAAIQLADQIRKVPAAKVTDAAEAVSTFSVILTIAVLGNGCPTGHTTQAVAASRHRASTWSPDSGA